ncbi:unnamed protein product [Vicia faba]|uniref:Uncharacterized protein n=1 Tax=Vicia faba TaxID=3906 RepID=A0AAV0ZW42_VICFA|nr:unnamed protein product [Vicia faba]
MITWQILIGHIRVDKHHKSKSPAPLILITGIPHFQKMALGGGGPQRGSAAATASMRRRKTAGGGASGGAAGTMLQFYTDDAPGLRISPRSVKISSPHVDQNF